MKENEETVMDDKTKSDLEHQYSPSRWSRRFGPEAVIDNHVSISIKVSQQARESIPYKILRYGEGANEIIDLYGSTLSNDSPLVIYIHGGYWQSLQRSISAYLVAPLFKKGIRVAVAGYDLAPTVSFERIIREMEELDTFITNWARINKIENIWYAGHSAGAYLIGTILRNRSENEAFKANIPVRGMIFISGIYDLVPLVDTYINDGLKLTRDYAQRCSLREMNLRELPGMTFLVAIAEYDSDEFRRQSQEFCEILIQGKHIVEFKQLSGVDHFDIVEKLNDDTYELTQRICQLVVSK